MTARDALRAMRERAEAASPEPWTADGLEGNLDSPRGRVAEVSWWREVDTQFIAHARTDVPALVEAVEAVLAIHKEQPYGAGMTRVAPGVPDYVCEHCATPDGGCVPYPCPTVTAIETALGGGS